MAAPTSYPSAAYNETQLLAVVVQNVAAFNALSGAGTWTTTPFIAASSSIPYDPGFITTDTRLQQILVETRLQNNLLAAQAAMSDDLVAWRQDIVDNDSGLAT